MNSVEMGRETLKYVGKTAKEISGIGRAQRGFKEQRMLDNHGVAESLFGGTVKGLTGVAMPLSLKSIEDGKGIGIGFGVDLAVNILALNFLKEGNIQAAFITKFGYNLLAQIAPDVAKLAKGKIFQRTK